MAIFDDILSGNDPSIIGGQNTSPLEAFPNAAPSMSPAAPVPYGPMQPPHADHHEAVQRFAQIMQTVLPALAAVAAFRQHALGSFTGGMLQGQEQQHKIAMDRNEQQYRRDTSDRLWTSEQRQQANADRLAAEQDLKDKQAAEDRIVNKIKAALEPFSENPLYSEGIAPDIAAGMAVDVPGVGRLSLPDAFKRIGVATDSKGNFHYGKYKAPEKTPLITAPPETPGGPPTRQPDKPGAPVYTPPRPESKPTTRAYTWTDNKDPGSETYGKTYRIVEDEHGNVTSMKEIKAPGIGPEPPNMSPAPPKHKVNDRVKLKDGRTVTIKKINPDGSFNY